MNLRESVLESSLPKDHEDDIAEKLFNSSSHLDTCHFKNADLEPKYQKYKGRVVLRGDIVQDDSGSYAVFTEQSSSASQMTAAEVMDVIARLSDSAGQAADAVVQVYGYVFHDTSGRNHGQPLKTWWFLLSAILYGHTLADLLWDRQFEQVLLGLGLEKAPNWECLFVHRNKDESCRHTWMTLNWLEGSRLLLKCGRN